MSRVIHCLWWDLHGCLLRSDGVRGRSKERSRPQERWVRCNEASHRPLICKTYFWFLLSSHRGTERRQRPSRWGWEELVCFRNERLIDWSVRWFIWFLVGKIPWLKWFSLETLMKILPGGLNWWRRFNLIIWRISVRSVQCVSEALQTLISLVTSYFSNYDVWFLSFKKNHINALCWIWYLASLLKI